MSFEWTKPRSGNPSIPTVPYREEDVKVLAIAHPWFRVYALPGNIYAIHEPWHAQGVISYLIIGSEQALLFDTGMGVSDICALIKALTDKPVFVVLSHTHFDHVGGNSLFKELHAFDCGQSRRVLAHGISHDELSGELTPEQFYAPYPPGYDPGVHTILPHPAFHPVRDGDFFELGGRTLEVLHTPGHSDDSIMLLDRASGELFTGDTYYPGRLFVFSDHSCLPIYRRTLDALPHRLPVLSVIHPSHNLPQDDPANLALAARCMALVDDGKAGEGHPMGDMKNNCLVFDFDGCSIVVRKEDL